LEVEPRRAGAADPSDFIVDESIEFVVSATSCSIQEDNPGIEASFSAFKDRHSWSVMLKISWAVE
jgi:hypothetical protein